jgi:hypothetical protein
MKHIKLFEEFEWGAGDKDGSMPSLLPVDSEFISYDVIKKLGLKLKKAFTEKGFKIIEPYNGAVDKPKKINPYSDAKDKKEISIAVSEDHYNQFYNIRWDNDTPIQQYSVVKLKGTRRHASNTDHEKMPAYEKILMWFTEENKDEVMSILKDNTDNTVKMTEEQESQHGWTYNLCKVSLYIDLSKI